MHTEHQQNAATNSSEPSATNQLDNELRNEINQCNMTQDMIEINIKHLVGLRTECDVTETLTQNDIRILENKLVRLFSRQIVARNKFCKWKDVKELRSYPLLSQWFQMVGLDDKCKEILSEHFDDIDDLMKVSEEDLQNLILSGFSLNLDELNSLSNIDDESESEDKFGNKENDCIKRDIRIYVKDYIKRLLKAQRCLCTCVEAMNRDSDLSPDVELYWDSWDHWISKSDASKIAIIAAAIAEASKNSSHKTLPQPLPPLPALRTSRLVNYRTNGDNNSKSTGSSPLSPPAPPLSAGNNSHRSTLSTSSSSSSIIPSGFYNLNNNIIVDPNHAPPLSRRPTPPPTPPVSHHKKSFIISSSSIFSNSRKPDSKFPTTPPPIRRHQANLFSSEQFPLTKSKSHEEHLSNRIEPLDPVITSKLLKKYNLGPMPGKSKNSGNKHNSLDNLPHAPHQYRRRLATEPGSIGSTSPILTSSNCSSPVAISPDNQFQSDKQPGDNCFLDNSVVPRSPRSQGMLHSIHHRFVTTMKLNSTLCNVCEKQMFIGYKCRDCKYYSHRDCLEKAPNSCGLPIEFFDVFKQTVSGIECQNRSSSPVVGHKNLSSASFSHRSKNYMNNYNQVNSSHSSSNPSSPSLFNHTSSSSSAAISPTSTNSKGNSQFQFPPDINITLTKALSCDDENGIPSDPNLLNDDDNQNNFSTIHEEEETQRSFIDSEKSTNSSLITSGSSGDSVRTLTGRFDSQDSQASDIDQNDRHWPRQNSLTSREWDIPYDELEIEEEIGTGRFGTVFRGSWHGSVAIKRINMGNNIHEDRKAMETFKQEVANFRKTRHDNLVLFMGACMKPPHLAIVTSLCKGLTLHTHIHIRHDKFNPNRTIMIAEQICLGMGYLHARGIVHKDLKTKNIFYENGKVIITDFGLSSVAKLCVTNRRGNWLTVPKGWLCYLSPEIIRTLSIHSQETDHLPFSFNTDVYAFGTVWYELLCGSWPFSGQPSEVIIWQVGKGIKQMLNHFQGSKEVKELLFLCWSFSAEGRPDFSKLYEHLQKLPKKRLQRSPSHPAHLQHTSEQAFF